jgi:hypothetical protein
MFLVRFLIGLTLSLTIGIAVPAQGTSSPQPFQRDAEAIQILTQALNAAGGIATLGALKDYTASGTVNYYWGDGEQGTVVVKGRGTGQFRIDATLPEGVRSWSVSNGSGWIKEANGGSDVIFAHNAMNLGSLTFPFTFLISALQDPSVSLIYVGLESNNGISTHHIRTQRNYSPNSDPAGILQKLSRREFFIDSSNLLIVASEDMAHPRDNATIAHPRRIEFSDYRKLNDVLVPFLIAESVEGQRGETIQLNEIAFNVGLQDSDFAQ